MPEATPQNKVFPSSLRVIAFSSQSSSTSPASSPSFSTPRILNLACSLTFFVRCSSRMRSSANGSTSYLPTSCSSIWYPLLPVPCRTAIIRQNVQSQASAQKVPSIHLYPHPGSYSRPSAAVLVKM